jgi:DNA-binding beta-propeller fold protein YncE
MGIVGSLPTTNGMAATARAGCLILINSRGRPVRTISGGPINGPWDMTWQESRTHATLFVTNVLNGTVAANGATVNRGTVVRIRLGLIGMRPRVVGERTIGSRFPTHSDPAALVVGPTGLGLSRQGTRYVADSASNRIAAIPRALTRMRSAGIGMTVTRGGLLADPLGLVVGPNGNILTVNGTNGRVVETTPAGDQIASRFLDRSGTPPGSGALFGLAVAPGARGLYYVDDATNTLNLLR